MQKLPPIEESFKDFVYQFFYFVKLSDLLGNDHDEILQKILFPIFLLRRIDPRIDQCEPVDEYEVPDLVEKNKTVKIQPKLTSRLAREIFKDSDWIKKIKVPVKLKETKAFSEYIKQLFVHYYANNKIVQYNLKVYQTGLSPLYSKNQLLY